MEHPNHYPRGTCSGTDAAIKAAEGNYYMCPKCKKDIHENDIVFYDGSDCIGPTPCEGSELERDDLELGMRVPAISVRGAHVTRRKMPLNDDQRKIMDYLKEHETIDTYRAIRLLNLKYCCNPVDHVGTRFARMVKRGMVVRVKPGVFRAARGSE